MKTDQTIATIRTYFLSLQAEICHQLETLDAQSTFLRDAWERSEGGGGLTCVLREGGVFEQAGVNFSHVHGASLPGSASATRPDIANRPFQALGVSSVLHPRNPYIPTVHMNVRFFLTETEKGVKWWFGGGFDLTPYYPFTEDCVFWHTQARAACEPFGAHLYPAFKAAADSYFYLKHRDEARGIGGLFFDDFDEGGFEQAFALTRSVGDHYMKAYLPIVQKRKDTPYSERQKTFQEYRRGRYVEFNLVYDRGTLFGLQSNGRTESILMSLPPVVRFGYQYHADEGTPEAALTSEYLKPRDWLADAATA